MVELSADNAALSSDVNDIIQQLQAQDLVRQNLEQAEAQLEADYQDARETLEAGVVNDDLGRILLQQFDALPDLEALVQNDAQRRAEIADLTVRRLEHRAEARRIADAEATVARLMLEMQADAGDGSRSEPRQGQEAKLLELVQQRQTLLEQALETYQLYLGKLNEVDRAEQALLATAAEYDAYLDEQLPWLRNAKPIRLDDIRAMPAELGARLAANDLAGLPLLITRQLATSPVFWLALLGAAVLLVRRRAIIRALESVTRFINKPTTDRMRYTWRVLGLTLLLAAPLPLLLAALGWQLQADVGATVLSDALGDALIKAAQHLFILLLLGAICLPRGLAAVHFRWPERNLELLRAQLRLFVWPFVAAVIIVNIALGIDPAATGGTLAKLALVLGFLPLSWFLYQVFHRRHGVLGSCEPAASTRCSSGPTSSGTRCSSAHRWRCSRWPGLATSTPPPPFPICSCSRSGSCSPLCSATRWRCVGFRSPAGASPTRPPWSASAPSSRRPNSKRTKTIRASCSSRRRRWTSPR
jgi:potassium efflux system protein